MPVRRALPSLLLAALLAVPAVAEAAPLFNVAPTRDLACRVANQRSDWLSFFADPDQQLGSVKRGCGVVVAVRGGGFYGPRELAGTRSRLGGRRLTPLEPVSQSASGDGRPVLPRRYVTVATAGPLRVREVDVSVEGRPTVHTRLSVRNESAAPVTAVVTRLARCFPGLDPGYGLATRRVAACVPAVQAGPLARPVAGRPLIALSGRRSPASASAAPFERLADTAAAGHLLAGPCRCRPTPVNVGVALAWTVHLAPGAVTSVRSRLIMSAGPARARTTLEPAGGARRLGATLRRAGSPLVGRHVTFTAGGRRTCAAVTDRHGRASCPWTGPGPRPRYTARFGGSLNDLPASAAVAGPAAPVAQSSPNFPACARPGGLSGVVTQPESHFAFGLVATRVPTCSFLRYSLLVPGRGKDDVAGSLRGNGSRRLAFFLTLGLGDEESCSGVRVTDLRTGLVLFESLVVCTAGSQKAR